MLVAAIIVTVTAGIVRLDQLASSQVTNVLAAYVVRAIVAASLVVVMPSLVAMIVSRRVSDE